MVGCKKCVLAGNDLYCTEAGVSLGFVAHICPNRLFCGQAPILR